MINRSCFVSYAHAEHGLMTSFINQLDTALKNHLELYDLEPYLDRDRLGPGYRYNEALAAAICQSICMIVVYTPRYERHEYCRREFAAMEIVDERRRNALGAAAHGRGFIIPVILAGEHSTLPDRIRRAVHYADFSRYNLASREISLNPEFIPQIEAICRVVAELHRLLETLPHAAVDCGQFALPDTAAPWRAVPVEQQPFPNR